MKSHSQTRTEHPELWHRWLIRAGMFGAGWLAVQALLKERRVTSPSPSLSLNQNENLSENRDKRGNEVLDQETQSFQAGGSALGDAERERSILHPPRDIVDEASFESFPASDTPSWW